MDNLVNYGSDDDNVDSDNSSKYRQGTLGTNRLALHGGGGDYGRLPSQQRCGGGGGGGATSRTGDDGTNYDQIQMDLSEEDEPAKNSVSIKSQMSPEMNRDRTNRPQHRDNSHYDTNDRRGNNRQRDGRDNRDSISRNVDRDREQRENNHRHDNERDNKSNVKDSRDDQDRSSYRGGRDQQRNEKRNSRDSRDSGARKGDRDSRDSTRRDNRENNRDSRDGVDNRKDRDTVGNRDRDNSNRRDRDNFNSRDRGDRDNYNNRDNRQRDNRRRSPTNQNSNNYRGGAAGRRFDRASNKLAQLEKLGIEIKAPENFVPPASGIYTPDDARGNNGPYQFENADGGGDGQFFMPGVTGRFRDQIERRKQLWAKSKQGDMPAPTPTAPTQRSTPPTPTAPNTTEPHIAGRSTWAATTFAQDTDGRQANKFKRLMGIRGESGAGSTVEGSTNKRQEEMFNSMEAQYEVARTATHTMRGVGLGFSSAVQGLYQK